jgi:hypothetical protein
MPQQYSTARPCCEPGKPEGSANAVSPKRIKGVKNQPVDWNGEFEEKYEPGDGVQETHSTCFRMFCEEQRVQGRVADQSENEERPSQ